MRETEALTGERDAHIAAQERIGDLEMLEARIQELESLTVPVNAWGVKLFEALGEFLQVAATAGKPMTTAIAVRFSAEEEALPIVHLWATTDAQDPAARCRLLAAERDQARARVLELEHLAEVGRRMEALDIGCSVEREEFRWAIYQPKCELCRQPPDDDEMCQASDDGEHFVDDRVALLAKGETVLDALRAAGVGEEVGHGD